LNKSSLLVALVFITVSFLFSFTCDKQKVQAQIVLSEQTIGQFDILIYDTSIVLQQFAAKELQDYLSKIYGKKINITNTQNSVNKYHFLLGTGFVNDSLFSTDTISEYALIQCVDKCNVYLAGYDIKVDNINNYFIEAADTANLGTLFSTYDWLETTMGVNWFFPSALGEHVKKGIRILKQSIRIFEPAFRERTFKMNLLYYNKNAAIQWLVRNRTNKSYIRSYNHNWNRIISQDNYFDSLPEFFAQIDGQNRSYTRTGKYPQLCTTNKGLISLFIENIESIPEFQEDHCISISANDNRLFCECNDCTKLDTTIIIGPEYSKISNRMFTFYSTIADSILQKWPDARIGAYAYKQYSVPIENLSLPEQFHIRLAINNYGFGNRSCSTMDTLEMIINSWGNSHKNIGFYSFPYGNGWVYPIIQTQRHKQLLKTLAASRFNSIRFALFPEWYFQGKDIWILTKLMWNPDLSIDSLENIYFKTIYPNSFKVIKKIHKSIEENCVNFNTCCPNYNKANKEFTNIYLKIFDGDLLDETYDSIELIIARGGISKKEEKNLDNVLQLIRFLKLELKAYRNYKYFGVLPGVDDREEFELILERLKKSLCLPNRSNYYDNKQSSSLYIKKSSGKFEMYQE